AEAIDVGLPAVGNEYRPLGIVKALQAQPAFEVAEERASDKGRRGGSNDHGRISSSAARKRRPKERRSREPEGWRLDSSVSANSVSAYGMPIPSGPIGLYHKSTSLGNGSRLPVTIMAVASRERKRPE